MATTMTTTDQILSMMKNYADKNKAEGLGGAEWTEGTEAQFRFYLEKTTEEHRLEILADKEGQEKYSIFGVVVLKGYFPLGGLVKKEEEDEDEGSDEQDTDGSDEDLNGAISVSGSAF